MKDSFTAIDFETAQGKRWSICQVGLVKVENNIITEKISLLIKPPGNTYFSMNTSIHGLSARHTWNAPLFSDVWHQLKPHIEHQTVVAHNGAFDFSCLSQTLNYYNIQMPSFQQQCTYKIFKKGLKECCRAHNISLDNHHDALSDACACAELYLKHLKQLKKEK